ncbi:hypothetical protein Tco_1191243 [Tanacetum coccineum]
MEEIFDQMSTEVDQNIVDKQCAEIERKNLLIANENLIANCLSNQLMFAVEQSRCLDLEAEISKLQNENQKDVNDEMIRGFNKLEVEYLNLQLKYQHLQENFRNNKSQTSQDVPEFDSFFRIKILETQLQEKDNAIRNLKAQVSKMNDRSCETYNAKDVTALIEQNECVRVELEKVKQHYKELYDSIKITRVTLEKRHLPISVNATPTVKIVLNKGKQIWKPKGKLSDNSLNKSKRVWKATGKKFALGELCHLTKLSVKCCSKHMTEFVQSSRTLWKRTSDSREFGNDHFGSIMGYGDYVIGDGVISRVYYVEGLGHNLFYVGQFCDLDLEIAFRKHS